MLALAGVALQVFSIARVALAVIVAGLIAASTYCFAVAARGFENDVREASMDLSPAARRRFYEVYESFRPRNPAIAWFLALAFGPIGENVYRGRWPAFFLAVATLNGLGTWSLVSWFTTPHLVTIENRELAQRALEITLGESAR